MTSPMKLAHVVYRTDDHLKMADWYCKVLDGSIRHKDEMLAFMSYDDEHHRLAFAKMGASEQPGERTRGVDHVAFTYASIGDLLATWERLDRAGIKPVLCINHGPTTSMYYEDPERNRIELQVDNMSMDEANNFIQSERFKRNPFGILFTPEELLHRYRSGEAQEELVKWPDSDDDCMPPAHLAQSVGG